MTTFPFDTDSALASELNYLGDSETIEHNGQHFTKIDEDDPRGANEITFKHEESGRFFTVTIPYDSWEGCWYSDADWTEVRPVTKTITVYEVVR